MRQENIDFIALYEASGWSEAEAARHLETTRASVNRWLTGELTPKKGWIKLFKLILAEQNPGALTAASRIPEEDRLAEWERKILEDLRWLQDEDRQRVLKAMKALMDGLPRKAPVRNMTSSKTHQVAGQILKEVVAHVKLKRN